MPKQIANVRLLTLGEIRTSKERPCADYLFCRNLRPGRHHLHRHRKCTSDTTARRQREREFATTGSRQAYGKQDAIHLHLWFRLCEQNGLARPGKQHLPPAARSLSVCCCSTSPARIDSARTSVRPFRHISSTHSRHPNEPCHEWCSSTTRWQRGTGTKETPHGRRLTPQTTT